MWAGPAPPFTALGGSALAGAVSPRPLRPPWLSQEAQRLELSLQW